MAQIIIPDRLAARLAHDEIWKSYVTQFKLNIAPLLAKDPDFFPDYTIHGIDHINRVLDIADHLIDYDTLSEEPQKTDLLTPRDVAFLVCGIMLHDMGMFLRPDGLRKLVKMDSSDDAFGGKPWNDEWSNYVDRTKRLSQEKMRYHFGKVISVTEDCVDRTDTDDNKRIIGEFLRQHHARLAHEFAVGVLPGSDDTDLFENTGFDSEECNLIGLLARSHGMAIRDTEEYLKRTLGEGSSPDGIPVFYLMTVLRLADALEADEQRAPEKLEKQQKINVPISVEEWTWNQCIKFKSCTWRLAQKNRYIKAVPESSPQYVQLDKWLKSVQADLDLCWSILAEKYPYDRYRLSIHRVVSNIHEPGIQETMNETFLTKEVKVTANPEIVKLMMEPLYGDDPTYGVRELLQNAVDACLEREQWEKNHGNTNYKGLVDIRIENGTFTITDNGMGMNEDVLLNYYLSAGSSYRSSDAWMAANSPDGESRVARTGKFGVGFLAAFLLGNEIEVHTQHLDDTKGYQFKFDQRSMPLDIKRKKRNNPYATGQDDPVGTTISIVMSAGALEKIESNNSACDCPWYGWYAFDYPVVEYCQNGKSILYSGIKLSRFPERNKKWFSLPSTLFDCYQWMPNMNSDEASFYCNGIRIYEGIPEDLESDGLKVYMPHISLLDNNASLSIELSRKKLGPIPQKEELYKEVFRYHIARLLLTSWDEENHYRNLTRGFLLRSDVGYGNIPFLLSERGFTLNYDTVIAAMEIKEYLILYESCIHEKTSINNAKKLLDCSIPYTVVGDEFWEDKYRYAELSRIENYDCTGDFLNDFFEDTNSLLCSIAVRYKPREEWVAAWIQEDVYQDIYEANKIKWEINHAVHKDGVYAIGRHHTDGIIDTNCFDFRMFPVVIQIRPRTAFGYRMSLDGTDSLFISELRTVLDFPHNDMWIPYDMEERRRKFPKAFDELAHYMEYIEMDQHLEIILAERTRDLHAMLEEYARKFVEDPNHHVIRFVFDANLDDYLALLSQLPADDLKRLSLEELSVKYEKIARFVGGIKLVVQSYCDKMK